MEETLPRLMGPLAKTARANAHLSELAAALNKFLAERPYRVASDRESEPGVRIYRFVHGADPAPQIGAMIGDVLQNLRAALDLLAWQLVEANGQVPDRDTHFPIVESAENLKGDVLRGASREACGAIRAIKPYAGGDNDLWLLHRLSIEDRHMLLRPVASAYRKFAIPINLKTPKGVPLSTAVKVAPPVERARPQHGDILLQVDASDTTEPQFEFELVFAHGIADDRPVMPALRRMQSAVNRVIEVLAPHLEEVTHPGEWWFGTSCSGCGGRLLMFRDTSDGAKGVPYGRGPGAKFQISCPSCGLVDVYSADVIDSQPV